MCRRRDPSLWRWDWLPGDWLQPTSTAGEVFLPDVQNIVHNSVLDESFVSHKISSISTFYCTTDTTIAKYRSCVEYVPYQELTPTYVDREESCKVQGPLSRFVNHKLLDLSLVTTVQHVSWCNSMALCGERILFITQHIIQIGFLIPANIKNCAVYQLMALDCAPTAPLKLVVWMFLEIPQRSHLPKKLFILILSSLPMRIQALE